MRFRSERNQLLQALFLLFLAARNVFVAGRRIVSTRAGARRGGRGSVLNFVDLRRRRQSLVATAIGLQFIRVRLRIGLQFVWIGLRRRSCRRRRAGTWLSKWRPVLRGVAGAADRRLGGLIQNRNAQ